MKQIREQPGWAKFDLHNLQDRKRALSESWQHSEVLSIGRLLSKGNDLIPNFELDLSAKSRGEAEKGAHSYVRVLI